MQGLMQGLMLGLMQDNDVYDMRREVFRTTC